MPYCKASFKKYAQYVLFFIAIFCNVITNAQGKGAFNHPRIAKTVDSLNNLAAPLIRKDAGKAFTMLTQAELLSTEYHYTKGLAVVYLNQAGVLSQRGYSKRALELYYRSMQLSQRNNDMYYLALAEQHISSIKRKDGGLKEADTILNRTLKLFKKVGKAEDIASIQLKLGLLKTEEKKFNEAQYYFNEAYKVSTKAGYAYGEKKSYYNRALMHELLHQNDSAIFFLNKALHIDTVVGDAYGKALSYIELSRVYVNTKRYDKALIYAKLGYNMADSVAALELVKTAVKLLVYVSKEAVDKDAVIQWQDELIEVDNTLTERERKESSNFIDALRMQEEQQIKSQKRIMQVEQRTRQQDSLIVLYTGFLLVFVIVVFTLSYNYKKAKKYSTELNAKNNQIQKHAAELDKLNNAVMEQNQRLEDDNELKSKLLSIITHDLRKPLANTQSIIHLVNMDMVTPEESKELFEQLEAQYTRVMGLTDNLLFWIKGQVSGTPIEHVPVNMFDVVNSIVEEQKIPLSEKEIQVENTVTQDIIWLAETETLRIIFRNLLNNAIKFTPAGGRIEIYNNNTDIETCITMKDSGIGMSSEVMTRINSENYYSTKGTQNEEGSGFGLMLVRDLIKKQNGRLQIDSKPGQGSAFTITFPISTLVTA
jgi:two-component system sensor histidine kinase/response regulator